MVSHTRRDGNGDKGLIFDIQRYSLHDGPGIRSLVFFKGCPLSCSWCCNPESQAPIQEMAFFQDRCVGCGKCIRACPHDAISVKDGVLITHRNQCSMCSPDGNEMFPCCSVCLTSARETIGKWTSIDEVMNEVLRDVPLYKRSNGGLTITGGEPLSQPLFLKKLLLALRENWIHTAVETCGDGSWDHVKDILELTDLLFLDIKAIDATIHKKLTGRDNRVILDNARQMAIYKKKQELPVEIIYRIPLIPVAEQKKEVIKILDFISEHVDAATVEFMLYHRLGRGKYQTFGRDYTLENLDPLKKEAVIPFKDAAVERKLKVI